MSNVTTKTQDAATEDAKLLEAWKKAQATKRQKAFDNASKYPHALVKQHFVFDSTTGKDGKYQTKIKCQTCGDENRLVYTSDLFQVKHCVVCAKKAKDAAKETKKALAKRGAELAKLEAEGKLAL